MPKNNDSSVPVESSLTLAEIQEVLGDPDPDAATAILEGATEAELVALGRKIASRHILSDSRRIYAAAHDFWTHATAPQKGRLRGFTPGLLSVAVARTQLLARMAADHTARADGQGTVRDARDREAKAAFEAAIALRDQAVRVLRGVAGRDAQRLAEVDVAAGTAESGDALATGVDRLATLGAKWLAVKKGALAQRAQLMQLDAGYVSELKAAAARLKGAAEKATARSGGSRVTQGALDAEDGANLLLLGHIVQVFEAAHDLDPTIPRLVPIATRRLLAPYSPGSRAKGGGEEEAGETAGAGGGTSPA